MSLAIPEMYKSKCNSGWPRLPYPWTLKAIALKKVFHYLSQVGHPLGTVSEVKLREYISAKLRPEFFEELIHVAHYNLLKPESLVNVLYALPQSAYETRIDLLGFYEGTECCMPGNSTNWISGCLPDIYLDTNSCVKLVTLMDTLELKKLQTLRFWTREGNIRASHFPHILTKATNLTSLTLRGDANDHLLRLIGANCRSLKMLDIGRSSKVTANGLFNMVLKQRVGGWWRWYERFLPFRVIMGRERMPIAASLKSLTLTIGSIPILQLERMAALLSSYLVACFPEAKMLKLGSTTGYDFKIAPNLQALEILELNLLWGTQANVMDALQDKFLTWISLDLWTVLRGLLTITLIKVGDSQLDVYKSVPDDSIYIFAHKAFSSLLHVLYKVSLYHGITDLVFYWDTFTWDIAQTAQFTEIATRAPNLESLQGRIRGIWEGPRPILANLTRINCWILEDATIISILRSCPNLELVDINNFRVGENHDGVPVLFTHDVLMGLFDANSAVWPKLKEFMIRPTNLRKDSVLELVERCPKLIRIGDLECWDVTSVEIQDLNKALYHSGSQCSLVVLCFPPPREI